ncbi:MAG: 2-oxo acid dehydrogenase subunit E2, partial [Caulobacteraceae bacterium]|nr:2-oxo acid dehydrogenase subunit E2 [Caulobacter sp.]
MASTTAVDVTVPVMGESVSEGTVGTWTKKVGDKVKRDEVLVEIETDKVAVEVSAAADGILAEILAKDGDTVTPNQVIARIGDADGAGAAPKEQPSGAGEQTPANEPPAAQQGPKPAGEQPLSPSVQRIVTEGKLDPSQIAGSGKDGRITKGDALQAAAGGGAQAKAAPAPAPPAAQAPSPQVQAPSAPRADQPREERVRMTRLRQTIARRLKESQATAAQLTTFNEVDMSAIMALRAEYKDVFEKKHGVKLGFMSVFTKAVVHALKE